jgi:hypothetical protein
VKTATFDPQVTIKGYDPNGDGHYDYLQVDVTVHVEAAGGFGFSAFLESPARDLIATGDMITDELRSAPVMSAQLAPGQNMVNFYFNGRNIRAARHNGPYIVTLGIFDENGAMVDLGELESGPFSWRDFE